MKKLRIIALIIFLSVMMAAPATAQMRMRGEYGRGQHTMVPVKTLKHGDLLELKTKGGLLWD